MKKFEKILIVTDLDGTFFGEHGRIIPRNIERLKYFVKNGGRFTIATGRTVDHVFDSFEKVGEVVNLPAITCNGTLMYDFRAGQTLSQYPMPYYLVRELVEFVHKNFSTAGLRGAQISRFVATPRDMECPIIRRDIERRNTGVVLPLDEWKELDIFKFAVRDDAERLAGLRREIEREFSDRLEITQSYSNLLDVQLKGRTKAVMIRELICEQGVEDLILCACGDYDNDIEMLEMADIAVCPSGAVEKVRSICDLTLCSCDEGLLGDLIDELDRGIIE